MKEVIKKIQDGHYVTIKVTVHSFETRLEVVNSSGIVVQHKIIGNIGNAELNQLQIEMLKKAGEYKNRGLFVIINPFTN